MTDDDRWRPALAPSGPARIPSRPALTPSPPALSPSRPGALGLGLLVLLLTVLALSAAAAGPASAAGGWSRPFRLAAPTSLDVIPAEIAFSASGDAAVAFGVQDADTPSSSSGFLAVRSASGQLAKPQRVSAAQEILALAYDGPGLQVLVGTSRRGDACCGSVGAGSAGGQPRRLVGGLAGATDGRLVTLPNGSQLAAVATERGVWVSQSAGFGGFGAAHRLTPSGTLPEALEATALSGGHSAVAWTARTGPGTPFGPMTIFISKGSMRRAPRGQRAAFTVPPGHRIDELAVARGRSAPTVAWIESWYDLLGAYHSQAVVADLGPIVQPAVISDSGELASGLAFAADTRGDQAVAWKGCTLSGDCVVRGALRSARGHFARTQTPAPIDASQAPAVALAPGGEALFGWVNQGHVLAAAGHARTGRFGAAHTISRTGFAADLALAFGPAGQAVAAWTQGTLAQSVVGAVYRAR